MDSPVTHSAEALGRPSRAAATAALEAHLEVLKGEPLRLSLSNALKEKPLGGHERRFAALATRELSRHMRLLDGIAKALGHAPSSWALKEDQALVRYVLWRRVVTGAGREKVMAEVKLPGPLRPRSVKDPVLEKLLTAPLPEGLLPEDPFERAVTLQSFPNWLGKALEAVAPQGEFEALLAGLNAEPGIVLRVRGDVEAVAAELAGESVETERVPRLAGALRVAGEGMRVFETRAMKGGRLQVMDVGSQLIVAACRPAAGWAGARVVDLCAGAAGKTVALADAVGAGGSVSAGDASARRLREGKARVGEYRLKNVTFPAELPVEQADVVLVDAPCSGVGSLPREPDQKWKLTAKGISEFAGKQRGILDGIAGRVKVGAVVVYATCSLLREEDEAVVEGFLAAHPEFELEPVWAVLGADGEGVCVGAYLRVYPQRVAGGGFFAARMRRKG